MNLVWPSDRVETGQKNVTIQRGSEIDFLDGNSKHASLVFDS